ncbi:MULTISPECIES: shikimate dehydrogenase [unclassified Iodidimonas]|jgi:shikimate dehydrogenase|uniref:shikimate dehydrogenase n=1 Tax=unclassified Iodidimonas TaxID=2626145 RepID=UPI002482466B|nr:MULTISPECIES: shikimate dehydrogenase [unclassified Iodidimonas]
MAHQSTKLAGVMGWPIGHSLSPHLHRFWLDRHGLAGDYVPLMVRPQNLASAIKGLYPLGFSGVNLTVPHKEAAMALVDRVDPLARRIGAINCISIDAKGRLEGRNTDAYGFFAHLEASAPNWQAKGARALVLGAGGAARAIIVALLDAGLEQVFVVNRTGDRARALADDLGRAFGNDRVCAQPWQDRTMLLKEVSLLVNSTVLGMMGQPSLSIELSLMAPGSVVYDIVYKPLLTPLLKEAEARRLVAVDGLGMLIHQAVPAFHSFFGVRPEADDDVRSALLKALESAGS